LAGGKVADLYVLTAVGRDRPGIVAAISGVLVEEGVNIEDSQMAILRGRFCMLLILAAPPQVGRARLHQALEAVGERLGLDAVVLAPLSGGEEEQGAEPSCLITVYGADHPGIVHAVTSLLAEKGVNITDLQTKVGGEQDNPIYVMFIEAALPAGLDPEGLSSALAGVGEEQGVEVQVAELPSDVI